MRVDLPSLLPILFVSSCRVDGPTYIGPDGDGTSPDASLDGDIPDGGPCIRRVAFTDGKAPDPSAFIANQNGTGLVELSAGGDGSWPAPSVTGRIYFTSIRSGANDIYSVRADGSDLINVTNRSEEDNWAMVSPDGTQVAFQRGYDSGGLYVMNADGSDAHPVAAGIAYRVSWNSQSTRLAFQLQSGSNAEIWAVNADGTDLAQLTSNPAYDGPPAWSPDGERVTFSSLRDDGSDIFVMNADGSGLQNITDDAAQDSFPSFSPDGSTIAYSSDEDIKLIPATGGTKTSLTMGTAFDDFMPRWSPDGEFVLFNRRDVTGRWVGIVAATGGDVESVVGPSGENGEPYSDDAVWAPCP